MTYFPDSLLIQNTIENIHQENLNLMYTHPSRED